MGGGGVWPIARGGGAPAIGGTEDTLEGGAESIGEPADSDVDERVEFGRGGGASVDVGITEAARGGGGVAVLERRLERPGEAVWAREGGGGGTFGAAASGPACGQTVRIIPKQMIQQNMPFCLPISLGFHRNKRNSPLLDLP